MRTALSQTVTRTALAGVLAVAVGGCTIGQWPQMRGGGMAELAPSSRSHLVVASQGSEKGDLYEQTARAEAALDALIERGAMTYMPGDTTLSYKLSVRIRREIAGDLLSDAETNLIELTDRLLVIDRRLRQIEVRLMDIATMS